MKDLCRLRTDAQTDLILHLPAVTEDEFRTFFAQFGIIEDSTVMIDRVTHRSRGFGFVTFDDESVSLRLLNQEDGTGKLEMKGKEVELKKAQPKHPTRATVSSIASPTRVTHHYFEEQLHQYGVPMHYYPAPMTPYYHPTGYDAVVPAPAYPVYNSYPYVVPVPSPTMMAESNLQ